MKTSRTGPSGEVRIIAGRLRGSKLPVENSDGLRPTSDRVRETLFNWLQGELHGATVIDLFAGSGALAFEAASRGASTVVAVERHPALARSLQASAERLGVPGLRVLCGDALSESITQQLPAADLVFVDPPFAENLWSAALAQVQRVLKPSGWIYLESSRQAEPVVPPQWRLHRQGSTREVSFRLYRREPAGPV